MGMALDAVMALLSPKRPAVLRMAPQFVADTAMLLDELKVRRGLNGNR
jgi:hypothetical protein